MQPKKTSVDPSEIKHFSELASEWWDPNGNFKILHEINPIRLAYIKEQIRIHFGVTPFEKIKVLDVGCGGGLVSVPMHRLGCNVTAIDASDENINVAESYAMGLGLNINFQSITTEELAKSPDNKFNVILALEVIEHVADYKFFLQSLKTLLSDDGIIIISTINRTLKSLALAKFAAEYILKWVPAGTHDWNKFLKPEEIKEAIDPLGMKVMATGGMSFNPLHAHKWCITEDLSINYFMTIAA